MLAPMPRARSPAPGAKPGCRKRPRAPYFRSARAYRGSCRNEWALVFVPECHRPRDRERHEQRHEPDEYPLLVAGGNHRALLSPWPRTSRVLVWPWCAGSPSSVCRIAPPRSEVHKPIPRAPTARATTAFFTRGVTARPLRDDSNRTNAEAVATDSRTASVRMPANWCLLTARASSQARPSSVLRTRVR
jgi:hypothetical protein